MAVDEHSLNTEQSWTTCPRCDGTGRVSVQMGTITDGFSIRGWCEECFGFGVVELMQPWKGEAK